MDRRRYLAAIAGGAALLAGCTEDTDYQNGDGGGGGGGGGDGSVEEDVVLQEHDLVRETDDFLETVSVQGIAENVGDSQLSYVEVRARFYDGTGNLLDSSLDNINDFGPGQTWAFEIQYLGTDTEAIADYDVGVGTNF